jgi:hypothetical protein
VTMRRVALMFFLLKALVAVAVPLPPGCPAVNIVPQVVGGFSWAGPVVPLGDACVTGIAVDPSNAQRWYVTGPNGLYVTADGGQHFTKPLNGLINTNGLSLVPGQPQSVYVGVGDRLYVSHNNGQTFSLDHTFPHPIISVLTAGGVVYVGLGWSDHISPTGVYKSGPAGWTLLAFGSGHTGLIVWTIARDSSGTLYAGTEIYDHDGPGQPWPLPCGSALYKPPFFRSANGGATWVNVAGTVPWHVIAAAVRPLDGFVYALTESCGCFGSANKGQTWQGQNIPGGPVNSLLMDPKFPKRLFGGQGGLGNVFVSVNAGQVFHPIGLQGGNIAGVALDGTSSHLYAAAYGSGIYISPVPANLLPN